VNTIAASKYRAPLTTHSPERGIAGLLSFFLAVRLNDIRPRPVKSGVRPLLFWGGWILKKIITMAVGYICALLNEPYRGGGEFGFAYEIPSAYNN
jgi:hypothetical protein